MQCVSSCNYSATTNCEWVLCGTNLCEYVCEIKPLKKCSDVKYNFSLFLPHKQSLEFVYVYFNSDVRHLVWFKYLQLYYTRMRAEVTQFICIQLTICIYLNIHTNVPAYV